MINPLILAKNTVFIAIIGAAVLVAVIIGISFTFNVYSNNPVDTKPPAQTVISDGSANSSPLDNNTGTSSALSLSVTIINYGPNTTDYLGSKEMTVDQLKAYPMLYNAMLNASQTRSGAVVFPSVNTTEALRTINGLEFHSQSYSNSNIVDSKLLLHYNNKIYNIHIMTPAILSVTSSSSLPKWYSVQHLNETDSATYPTLTSAIMEASQKGRYSSSIDPREARSILLNLKLASIPTPLGYAATRSANLEYQGKLYQISLSSDLEELSPHSLYIGNQTSI